MAVIDHLQQIGGEGAARKFFGGYKGFACRPGKILMTSPEYFTVKYAINPFMKDESGNINHVDNIKAQSQWQRLKSKYEQLGLQVVVLQGQNDLPDMVFMANQSFPYLSLQNGQAEVIMSRMYSEYRQPEVARVNQWYVEHGFAPKYLQGSSGRFFEGNGDALIDLRFPLIWGGYGHRTSRDVYEEIAQMTGYSVIRLELVKPEYYHLDTCFSILRPDTVAICPEAFNEDGLALIKALFPVVIEVDHHENLTTFACNCHSPDGKNVILNPGAAAFTQQLRRHDFTVHEVNTSEFMKSGGSVFCLKMVVWCAESLD